MEWDGSVDCLLACFAAGSIAWILEHASEALELTAP